MISNDFDVVAVFANPDDDEAVIETPIVAWGPITSPPATNVLSIPITYHALIVHDKKGTLVHASSRDDFMGLKWKGGHIGGDLFFGDEKVEKTLKWSD